jgi:predicted short-subunit dehydrogenase-like oxidoreductase (DUF2520 family)
MESRLYPVGTRREFSKGPGFCLSPKEVWIVSKKVGIIGAGVVGTAIGVVLHDKGYEITGVHDKKSESTKTLVDRIGCTTYASPQEVSRSTDILFITTNDSAIPDVVDELAQSRAFDYGQVLIHMSGAQTSAIFDKARALGAWGLSLHPLQSFASPDMAIENIPGSIFSIEGDQEAYEIAIDIVERLKGEYFFIEQEAKPLYHAGACVVSNYLVTLVNLGIKLLQVSGVSRELAGRSHFLNCPLLKAFMQLTIAPVLAHFRVYDVLVDSRKLVRKQSIQRFNKFRVSLHKNNSFLLISLNNINLNHGPPLKISKYTIVFVIFSSFIHHYISLPASPSK